MFFILLLLCTNVQELSEAISWTRRTIWERMILHLEDKHKTHTSYDYHHGLTFRDLVITFKCYSYLRCQQCHQNKWSFVRYCYSFTFYCWFSLTTLITIYFLFLTRLLSIWICLKLCLLWLLLCVIAFINNYLCLVL